MRGRAVVDFTSLKDNFSDGGLAVKPSPCVPRCDRRRGRPTVPREAMANHDPVGTDSVQGTPHGPSTTRPSSDAIVAASRTRTTSRACSAVTASEARPWRASEMLA